MKENYTSTGKKVGAPSLTHERSAHRAPKDVEKVDLDKTTEAFRKNIWSDQRGKLSCDR